MFTLELTSKVDNRIMGYFHFNSHKAAEDFAMLISTKWNMEYTIYPCDMDI